jgi:hypothetical protein
VRRLIAFLAVCSFYLAFRLVWVMTTVPKSDIQNQGLLNTETR